MNRKIADSTRKKRIEELIKSSKFLSGKKYFKTNKVGVAAWDSCAAQGQAGGCGVCNVGHHNYSVYNKRHTTKWQRSWHSNEITKLCGGCYSELEKQCSYEFEKW